MKLRNKETGEIRDADAFEDGIYLWDEYTERWFKYDLDILAESWEYCIIEPKEPLIKDEEVRKAVRAWYDLNTNKDFAVFCEDACTLSIAHSVRIEFLEKVFGNIKRDYGYSITELCGEEE